MAKLKIHYDNLIDRQTKIAEAESKTYRILHDDFDPMEVCPDCDAPLNLDIGGIWRCALCPWSREISGILTFTDEPPPVAELAKDLEAEIDDLKARVEKLEKK